MLLYGMSPTLQSVMLVNIIYFLYLCFVTLPIYSLVVHMGKVLREQTMPPEMRERLQRAQTLHEQVRSGPVHCLSYTQA